MLHSHTLGAVSALAAMSATDIIYLLYLFIIRDTTRVIKHNSHVVCVDGDDLFLKKFSHIRALVDVMSYCAGVYTAIVIVLAI